MSKPQWIITGYDGSAKTFRRVLPHGSLSDAEIEILLQRLASRHLGPDEIVGASLRKSARGYRSDLEVVRNRGGRFGFMTTGSSWFYTATISDSSE